MLSNIDREAASKMDAARDVTVTGKGTLDVSVSGPAGTRASASGEGLLKDTRVQQETQMTPASKGADLSTGMPLP